MQFYPLEHGRKDGSAPSKSHLFPALHHVAGIESRKAQHPVAVVQGLAARGEALPCRLPLHPVDVTSTPAPGEVPKVGFNGVKVGGGRSHQAPIRSGKEVPCRGVGEGGEQRLDNAALQEWPTVPTRTRPRRGSQMSET